ncbi:MAG: heavy-metal-associated domain-containing protein [Bacteroidales bacterium]|nr:heavy-metal-associated domain-containing protein [Bacteroidales bacterium]
MEKTAYKTNLKCNGCVAAVSPLLKEFEGIKTFNVDLENPDRILSIESERMNEEKMIQAVMDLGYQIEKI